MDTRSVSRQGRLRALCEFAEALPDLPEQVYDTELVNYCRVHFGCSEPTILNYVRTAKARMVSLRARTEEAQMKLTP